MGDRVKWSKLNTTTSAERDNVGGRWKATDGAELASIVDLSALSAADQATQKSPYHKYARMPHEGIMSVAELGNLQTLWDQCEP